ncbi:hypothetical protein V8G54_017637 [Vigna mungo]|uniref:Secreted protein n=1 Tax=Vigna mungo TaxID=3915 RepID=A0AAQ3NPU5_VIGMU
MIIKTSLMPLVLSLRLCHFIPSVPLLFPGMENCANSYNPRCKANPGYNSIRIIHPLGNDVFSTKNRKRKPPNSPVPKTPIYAVTVAVLTFENMVATKNASAICKFI